MSNVQISGKPNILVCIKFVPDPAQLQVDSDTGRPDVVRSPCRISTFDENAIEAGLRLAAEHGGRVIAVSICSQIPPRDVVLKVLAMGVSSVYLVRDQDRAAHDPLRVATVLSACARTIAAREQIAHWDLLICGEASADEYNQQVGPRLAAEMSLPSATYATALSITGGLVRADRLVEGRSEVVELDGPCVITVGNEINVPRMPTVLQIMGAGRKPLIELSLSDLSSLSIEDLRALPEIELLDIFAPPSARKKVKIKGETVGEVAAELLRRLSADGEVLL